MTVHSINQDCPICKEREWSVEDNELVCMVCGGDEGYEPVRVIDEEAMTNANFPGVVDDDEPDDKVFEKLENVIKDKPRHDPVNHPSHHTSHPSGVECIDIAEHYGFNIGNVFKYIWRAGLKGDAVEDLKKAHFYLTREIEKREAE